jgi:hypothetical protein
MMVNLAMEWITRQTYLDHLIIESQQDALFEERTSLARFLSPGIAETVHRTGFSGELACEIYSLTAVSIDLRGFTKYTQRHGAERMVEVLQDYYAAVGTAVNLSHRLCDIARDGQILMAAGTARALEESPGWRREIVTLSGVPESVEVTIEDTLHPHEMIPADRPGTRAGSHAAPGSIPPQPGAERETPVALD